MDTQELHKCQLPENAKEDPAVHWGRYGDAVTICYEVTQGELYADNGEYNNQVNYCPFCGYKAKVTI